MERGRSRIGRQLVDLAHDAVDAGGAGAREQVFVEQAAVAASAARVCNDDPVDVEKAGQPRAEPEKVAAVERVVVGEGDQEGDGRRHERRDPRPRDHPIEALRRQRRGLDHAPCVQSEQCGAHRRLRMQVFDSGHQRGFPECEKAACGADGFRNFE